MSLAGAGVPIRRRLPADDVMYHRLRQSRAAPSVVYPRRQHCMLDTACPERHSHRRSRPPTPCRGGPRRPSVFRSSAGILRHRLRAIVSQVGNDSRSGKSCDASGGERTQGNCNGFWHHLLSITLPIEGCVLFLTLIQLGDRPLRYLLSLRFETSPSNPIAHAA